ERYEPVEENHDDCLRDVEERGCRQPEPDVRRAESLGGGANPAGPDDVHDLDQDEIGEPQFPAEAGASRFDFANTVGWGFAGMHRHVPIPQRPARANLAGRAIRHFSPFVGASFSASSTSLSRNSSISFSSRKFLARMTPL